MSQPQERSAPRYGRRNAEEDRAWYHLYKRVGEYAVAAEVIQHLESDPQAKHTHLALYLRCKETLRRHKAIQKRNERIGSFTRQLMAILVVGPLRALYALLRSGGAIALEMLPQSRREPAVPRMQHLKDEPAFVQAKAEAEVLQVRIPAAAEPPASRSRSKKAA
jgi:hypothetical protein